MTDNEWLDWSQRHANIFGLNTDRATQMVNLWRDIFVAANYAAAELHEATTWLAAYRPPQFPSEHLAAIRSRIVGRRIAALEAAREKDDHSWMTCHNCASGGWVTVPLLKSVIDGLWVPLTLSGVPPTSAVACSCPVGERLRSNNEETARKIKFFRPPMRLLDYELRVPHWRTLMEQREREMRAEGGAHDAGKAADAGVTAVLNRLKAKARA